MCPIPGLADGNGLSKLFREQNKSEYSSPSRQLSRILPVWRKDPNRSILTRKLAAIDSWDCSNTQRHDPQKTRGKWSGILEAKKENIRDGGWDE